MLGMLYRQFSNHSSEPAMIRLYLTLVRPVLEYGAEVWHPHLIKDIQALENVQKFALRICSKQWQMSYPDLLNHFQIPTLEIGVYFCLFVRFLKLSIKLITFLLLLSHLTPLYLFYVHLILITILFPFPVPLDILTLLFYVLQNFGITYL